VRLERSDEWADRPIRAGRAAPAGWRRRLCARPCAGMGCPFEKRRYMVSCSLSVCPLYRNSRVCSGLWSVATETGSELISH
jgi:hypothetical protein